MVKWSMSCFHLLTRSHSALEHRNSSAKVNKAPWMRSDICDCLSKVTRFSHLKIADLVKTLNLITLSTFLRKRALQTKRGAPPCSNARTWNQNFYGSLNLNVFSGLWIPTKIDAAVCIAVSWFLFAPWLRERPSERWLRSPSDLNQSGRICEWKHLSRTYGQSASPILEW